MQLTCYYDYTCVYSYRAFRWLDRLQHTDRDLSVSWKTFSLKEANRAGDDPSVFDGPVDASVSVFALALAHTKAGPEFDAYHRNVFDAMHRDERHLDPPTIRTLTGGSGSPDDAAERDGLAKLAGEHRMAVQRHGVFGTPTLMFDEHAVVFLKLADTPTPGEETQLWNSLVTLTRCHPELLEIKRTT